MLIVLPVCGKVRAGVALAAAAICRLAGKRDAAPTVPDAHTTLLRAPSKITAPSPIKPRATTIALIFTDLLLRNKARLHLYETNLLPNSGDGSGDLVHPDDGVLEGIAPHVDAYIVEAPA